MQQVEQRRMRGLRMVKPLIGNESVSLISGPMDCKRDLALRFRCYDALTEGSSCARAREAVASVMASVISCIFADLCC